MYIYIFVYYVHIHMCVCLYMYVFFAHIACLHSIHDHLSKINRQKKREKKFLKSKYNWHTVFVPGENEI